MDKKSYRVRNWKDYNKSLVARGSITLWFSKEALTGTNYEKKSGFYGRPEKYSNELILAALTLKQLFNMTLRMTEGFVRSLMELTRSSCEAPHYSTLAKRGKTLKISLGVKRTKKPLHVLVDSTGVQVVGEGEWKALKHGRTKHQLWRKLHIAIDADNQTILAGEVTEGVRLDGNYLPRLVNKIKGPIYQITGDGAYDKKNCYETAFARNAKLISPPQHDAIVQRNKIKKNPALLARDKIILFLGNDEGKEERRKQWKIDNNYHRRSLVETMMSRHKFIFGDRIRAKSFGNQVTDLMIRCRIINKMNYLGLPKSVCID